MSKSHVLPAVYVAVIVFGVAVLGWLISSAIRSRNAKAEVRDAQPQAELIGRQDAYPIYRLKTDDATIYIYGNSIAAVPLPPRTEPAKP